jgi:hypothetical protein
MPTQAIGQRSEPLPWRARIQQEIPQTKIPHRRHRTVILAGVAMVVMLAAAGVAGWLIDRPSAASGNAAPLSLAWTAAMAPLPAGAPSGSIQGGYLGDVSCPAAGDCVAVGGRYYGFTPLIETLSDGAWTASVGVTGAESTAFNGVACPSEGSCVAVGYYMIGSNYRPVAATLADGTWTATDLPLPKDADRSTYAVMGDVRCPAQATCVATGDYKDQNGDMRPLIETLSGEKWAAMPAPLPAGAVATGQAIGGVACPVAGSCVAVGQYTEHSGATAPLTETLSGGTWTPAALPLPADAAADGQLAGLYQVYCRAAGSCLAVGHYMNRSDQTQYLIETLSGGTWTAATAPLPAGAVANQKWNQQQGGTTLTAVACQAVGSCVALGSYAVSSGTISGAIDTLSAGTWTTTTAPLPRGVPTTSKNGGFGQVACPVPSTCIAVGDYIPKNSSSFPLIETATSKQG